MVLKYVTKAKKKVFGSKGPSNSKEEAMHSTVADDVAQEVLDELEGRQEVKLKDSPRMVDLLKEDMEALYLQGRRQGVLEERQRSEDQEDIYTLVAAAVFIGLANLFINGWPVVQSLINGG